MNPVYDREALKTIGTYLSQESATVPTIEMRVKELLNTPPVTTPNRNKLSEFKVSFFKYQSELSFAEELVRQLEEENATTFEEAASCFISIHNFNNAVQKLQGAKTRLNTLAQQSMPLGLSVGWKK